MVKQTGRALVALAIALVACGARAEQPLTCGSTVPAGTTSNVLRLTLFDSSSSTGAPLTGLTSSSAGLAIRVDDGNGTAWDSEYLQASSNTETISTLGTYAAPSSNKARFAAFDGEGVYEIQLADAVFSESGIEYLLVRVEGATNLMARDCVIYLTGAQPESRAQIDVPRHSAGVITSKFVMYARRGGNGAQATFAYNLPGLGINLFDGGNFYTFSGSNIEAISTAITKGVQDDGGAYTDDTTDALDSGGADFPYPTTPVAADRLLIGTDAPISGMGIDVGTAGVGGYAITFKQLTSTGPSVFTALRGPLTVSCQSQPCPVIDGTNSFKTLGPNDVKWEYPPANACVSATFASQTANCWYAFEISATPSTNPVLDQVFVTPGAHYVSPTATTKIRVEACGGGGGMCFGIHDNYYDSDSQYLLLTVDDAAGQKTLRPLVATIFLDSPTLPDLEQVVENGVQDQINSGQLFSAAQGNGLSTTLAQVNTRTIGMNEGATMLDTTVSNVTDQTHLVLAADPGGDGALVNHQVCIVDVSTTNVEDCAWIEQFTSSSQTIRLSRALNFTVAIGDQVRVYRDERQF